MPRPRVADFWVVVGAVAAFVAAYAIKSQLGIDIFPDMHVQDALARTLTP